jgi:hypothetical protein
MQLRLRVDSLKPLVAGTLPEPYADAGDPTILKSLNSTLLWTSDGTFSVLRSDRESSTGFTSSKSIRSSKVICIFMPPPM